MSDVVEANDRWVLAMLKVDPVVLRTLPNGGAPSPETQAAALSGGAMPEIGQPARKEATRPEAASPAIDFDAIAASYVSDPAPDAEQSAPGAASEPAIVDRVGADQDAAANPYSYVSDLALDAEQPAADAASEPAIVDRVGVDQDAAANPYSYVSDLALDAERPAADAASEPAIVDSVGVNRDAAANPYFYVSAPAAPMAPGSADTAPGDAASGSPYHSGSPYVVAAEAAGGANGAGPGSPPGPAPITAQNAVAPGQLAPDELVQAMRDRMPLSTTTPEWAKDVDMTRARMGTEIKSGNFGTMSWIGGVDGQSLVIKTGKVGGDQKEVLANCATLASEANAYQKVGDHPNIAKCMGIQEIEGQRGLILEGVRGKDMNGTMTRLEKLRTGDKAEMQKLGLSQPLSQSEFVGMQQFMLAETLKGLKALEQAGVVHSDIRPDNIMVDKETGGIKLVDFGLAIDAGKRPENMPIGFGSVGPEVGQRGDGVTPKFDVFAAGEIARQGMERDQFRYGGTGTYGDNKFINDFREFGKLDADGKPLHQALEPRAAQPASSRNEDDYAGRMADLRLLVRPILNDDSRQNEASKESAISGDKTGVDQLRTAMKLCIGVFNAYNKAKRAGDSYELMAEKLGKVMADVERLLPRVKTTGTYAAETEYTKFVNWAMNPNPALRPSAAEAMKHPFLADALLDEGCARTLMKKLLADA